MFTIATVAQPSFIRTATFRHSVLLIMPIIVFLYKKKLYSYYAHSFVTISLVKFRVGKENHAIGTLHGQRASVETSYKFTRYSILCIY
ncbi:hypothetical protein T4D_7452 [Trichinella pseudospiralis]|uniref:Uncharacterized protein n=1 Tax=Trichinella pseudospiralis TaxID=6337 RepID=A0A0V1FEB7_TRIPS|nr:hypothetical protein T4D_7452 [Trichinella pseudospiralis]